jgi:hypothetical protein
MVLRRKYKVVLKSLSVIAIAAILTYAADGLFLHYRGTPHEDLRVDSMYAMTNRWNEVEYSVGGTGSERCVESLFPHDGFTPCWYLTRHAMHYIRIG